MARLPWRRKKTTSSSVQIPEEVNQYYESTRKERVGIAWLLALATLVLTILIALAIFFAGRWTYRRFISHDNSGSSSTAQNESNQAANQDAAKNSGDPSGTSSTNTDNTGTNGGASNNSSNNSAPAPVATPAPTQTPTTGPSSGDLPHTGPDVSD